MSIHLPDPIAAYFAAKNRHDIAAMLAPFHADARVKDEERTHAGSAEIKAWMEETTRKYRVSVEPTEAREEGGTWIVAGVVSGNFPGSPAVLHFRFGVDRQRIVSLQIGA